jgi:hypothetical protein
MRLSAALLFGAVFALASACGGSSSETPPPLRPDSKRIGVGGRAAAPNEERDAASSERPESEDGPRSGEDRIGVEPPAEDTWGGAERGDAGLR